MKSSREETVVFLKYVGRMRVPEGERVAEDVDEGVTCCDTAEDSVSVGMVA